MDNLQILRYITMLEQRLKVIENNGPSTADNSIIPTDLNEVYARLAAVEARPELSQRLSALELAVTSQNP